MAGFSGATYGAVLDEAKKYTDDSMSGAGAVAGKNCTIDDITHDTVNKVNKVTFKWTEDDGTVKTEVMNVPDGIDGAKGDKGDKGDDATVDIVTTFNPTTSDEKVPSEKLVKDELNKKVDKVTGKGLSTNDYDATEKAEVAKIKDKVDKVAGKGLSTNDYDDTEKAQVSKIAGKIDRAQGSANAGKILVVGADGNVTLGDDKGSDVVTAWETTPIDTKVPSEKLVKDSLDAKVNIAQTVADKGKALVVGDDGNITLGTVATDGLEIVDKTTAEYNALTDEQKNDATKLYNITDADDLDLTNYAKKSELDAISSVVTGMTKIKKIVTVMASSTTSQPVGSNEIVTLDLTSYGFTKVPKAFLVGTYANTAMITYLTTTQMKVQLINVYSTARSDMKAQYHLIEFE